MNSGVLKIQASYDCARQFFGAFPANGSDLGAVEYTNMIRSLLGEIPQVCAHLYD